MFFDPFSNAQLNPKVPDGKPILSSGRRFQKTINRAVAGPLHEAYLLLQPCITTPAVFNYTLFDAGDPSALPPVAPSWTEQNLGWLNHLAPVYLRDGASSTYDLDETNIIKKWRVVSQGVHMTLMNQSDSNDGWWEAYRINTPINANRYLMGERGVPTVTNGKQLMMFPKGERWRQTDNPVHKQGSYTQGRLRDIHRVAFTLNPNTSDHDFCDVINSITQTQVSPLADDLDGLNNTEDWRDVDTNSPVTRSSQFYQNAENRDFIKGLVDCDFDSLVVKCHCRVESNPATGRSSNLLIHVVQNLEIIYDEDAIDHQFMTRSPSSTLFKSASRRKRQQVNAATKIAKMSHRK